MPIRPLHVYCADIGAMRNANGKNNFGWAGRRITRNAEAPPWRKGTDMRELVNHVSNDLNQGSNVALGFECPLWIPIRNRPEELTLSRPGDGQRSWSAGAGAGSLVTGLAQIPWMLQAIHCKTPGARAFLDNWDSFRQSDRGLLIWEAFVSEKKGKTLHTQDAKAAVSAFAEALPLPNTSVSLPPHSQAHSLVGAALLWAGWPDDQDLLHQSCIVIKA